MAPCAGHTGIGARSHSWSASPLCSIYVPSNCAGDVLCPLNPPRFWECSARAGAGHRGLCASALALALRRHPATSAALAVLLRLHAAHQASYFPRPSDTAGVYR